MTKDIRVWTTGVCSILGTEVLIFVCLIYRIQSIAWFPSFGKQLLANANQYATKGGAFLFCKLSPKINQKNGWGPPNTVDRFQSIVQSKKHFHHQQEQE